MFAAFWDEEKPQKIKAENKNMSTPNDPQSLSERLTRLELMFMHLERQYADLNEVVLRQQRQLDAIERRLRTIHAPPLADEELPPDEVPDV
jgi:uncharacterized coiled-coil protein SlyX